jgi:hypothetical protein
MCATAGRQRLVWIAIDLTQADARPPEATCVVSDSMANAVTGGLVLAPNALRNCSSRLSSVVTSLPGGGPSTQT